MKTNYHEPVLLEEAVEGLNIKESGVYVDVTFGGGGHSNKILSKLGKDGHLLAFDQDEEALQNAIDDKRFRLINENFRYIRQFLKFYGINEVDGILADFGVSSHQFNTADRGFSTRFEAELDMRMSNRIEVSALEVLNKYDRGQLRGILSLYGELRNADAMARAIIEYRNGSSLRTSSDLKEALERYLPRHRENKILAQVFQAIRIEVNQELAAIREFLLQTPDLIKPGGRLSIISYHSLEDRLVKRFIRNGKFEGEAEKDLYGRTELPFKRIGKLIIPGEEEIIKNPRARSAKLRIAERI
ncbi:MAG: 16S rRNA (cytosine(1402)-N(4))-methyltransferase RsmH [Flavobacteriaceae bacterium]